MSYVVGGVTYDEGGDAIDAWGNRVGGSDPNKGVNQAKSATAANMGNGATIEDVNKAQGNPNNSANTFGTATSSPYLSTTSSSTVGAAPTAAPVDPRLNDLYSQLMDRSGQSLAVDANSPVVKNQVDAASVAGQRSLLNNEKAVAERAGPYATGAVNNNARMGAEALGQNLQGITAGAIGSEVAARRTEIAQALSGQFGILSQQDQDRLKQEDQALAARAQDIGQSQFKTTSDLSAQQQAWMQAFQEKGFTSDQAARLWQEMFNQQQQNINQSNTVWDQNWKASGGA
jgi:hypothetical protein